MFRQLSLSIGSYAIEILWFVIAFVLSQAKNFFLTLPGAIYDTILLLWRSNNELHDLTGGGLLDALVIVGTIYIVLRIVRRAFGAFNDFSKSVADLYKKIRDFYSEAYLYFYGYEIFDPKMFTIAADYGKREHLTELEGAFQSTMVGPVSDELMIRSNFTIHTMDGNYLGSGVFVDGRLRTCLHVVTDLDTWEVFPQVLIKGNQLAKAIPATVETFFETDMVDLYCPNAGSVLQLKSAKSAFPKSNKPVRVMTRESSGLQYTTVIPDKFKHKDRKPDPLYIYTSSKTMKGDSGSGVFQDGKVVAIHSAGCNKIKRNKHLILFDLVDSYITKLSVRNMPIFSERPDLEEKESVVNVDEDAEERAKGLKKIEQRIAKMRSTRQHGDADGFYMTKEEMQNIYSGLSAKGNPLWADLDEDDDEPDYRRRRRNDDYGDVNEGGNADDSEEVNCDARTGARSEVPAQKDFMELTLKDLLSGGSSTIPTQSLVEIVKSLTQSNVSSLAESSQKNTKPFLRNSNSTTPNSEVILEAYIRPRVEEQPKGTDSHGTQTELQEQDSSSEVEQTPYKPSKAAKRRQKKQAAKKTGEKKKSQQ